MDHILLHPEFGLEGDDYAGRTGKRQVTLIQSEHLLVIASMIKMEDIKPEQLRRNIVISDLNLIALKIRHFNWEILYWNTRGYVTHVLEWKTH